MVKIKVKAYKEMRTKISGVTHDDPYSGLNRQKVIKKYVRRGMELIPKLEPDNPYDPNAIGLWVEKLKFLGRKMFHIGYLNRTRARALAPILQSGRDVKVIVIAVTGDTRKKRTRGVNIVIRYS